jgi:ribokinase
MARVLVVGSINMDLVVQTGTFPRPGETLFGTAFATRAGGKGANQAVAAARLGAAVTLLGKVGDDAFGEQLKARLTQEDIDTRFVGRADGKSTGVAAITVCNADNAIIVIPGANALLSPEDVDAAENLFAESDVVLAQLEVPIATVERAAVHAARSGKPFILNPAPAMPLPSSLVARCTLITPNEYELATALGAANTPWRTLLATLPGRVLVTRGADGAYYSDSAAVIRHQPGFPVRPVDSTGAGDTFNGALAAFWHLGLIEAVRRGCAAGALSVTQPGAQEGMPSLAALEAYLARRP